MVRANQAVRPLTRSPAVNSEPGTRGWGQAVLTLGALGVVYGDIGTSPLYALQAVFAVDHGVVRPNRTDVFSVISILFWSITLVVSVKYVSFVMRADNGGEGGVLALGALGRKLLGGASGKAAMTIMAVGVLGASLFYGDSVITPAISVLSAVEGLKVSTPATAGLVVPVAAIILSLLFLVQRWGTHRVGSLFGPVMVIWFGTIGAAGLRGIITQPGVLAALSPYYAVAFIVAHPAVAFAALGAVVLAVTGAEALYADMGHFGRVPIRRTWFAIVFPALTLNYLGQAAIVVRHPASKTNPFFLLVPGWARLAMVVLATAATVIASQAVISGGFSVARQAVQLEYLPNLRIRHTSSHKAGQVYVAAVNWALFSGVLALVLEFRSAERLAAAYGVAVTGTFVITTSLFLVVARARWRWPVAKLAVAGLVFGGVELTFFAANLTKVTHGGWVPLLVAASVFTVMMTWSRGAAMVSNCRVAMEGPLDQFIDELRRDDVVRVPGTAVFPHRSTPSTPLALRANLQHNHVVHQNVVIFSIVSEDIPTVPPAERLRVDHLPEGVVRLSARYGFTEEQDIARAVSSAPLPALIGPHNCGSISYFVSRVTLRVTDRSGMSRWRKKFFVAMAHNASSPADFFCLPEVQTVTMGSQVDI
jgi:KUP system potassium uptake protein